ncbi:MAG: hypothetical protein ACK4MS_10590 [Paracoccaceae bacterium]
MSPDFTPEQALCVHLLHALAMGWTLPDERESRLALIKDHLHAFGAERWAPLRIAADQMLQAQNPLAWSFATREVTRALLPLHAAAACRLIAEMSLKRVS